MSTTELFVELLIIGIGAAIWVVLLIFSAFGYSWFALEDWLSIAALIPSLAIIYVLGIVIDRLCDRLFEPIWQTPIYQQYYDSRRAYFDDRRILYFYGKNLANLLEYGRSRLRICRGWSLNSVLIAISLNIFVWSQTFQTATRVKVTIFGTSAFLLFAFANWYVWLVLVKQSYRRVKEQSAFIRKQLSMEPSTKFDE